MTTERETDDQECGKEDSCKRAEMWSDAARVRFVFRPRASRLASPYCSAVWQPAARELQASCIMFLTSEPE
jgi:hypothetical protein